jgi:hypothetical protein
VQQRAIWGDSRTQLLACVRGRIRCCTVLHACSAHLLSDDERVPKHLRLGSGDPSLEPRCAHGGGPHRKEAGPRGPAFSIISGWLTSGASRVAAGLRCASCPRSAEGRPLTRLAVRRL